MSMNQKKVDWHFEFYAAGPKYGWMCTCGVQGTPGTDGLLHHVMNANMKILHEQLKELNDKLAKAL